MTEDPNVQEAGASTPAPGLLSEATMPFTVIISRDPVCARWDAELAGASSGLMGHGDTPGEAVTMAVMRYVEWAAAERVVNASNISWNRAKRLEMAREEADRIARLTGGWR